MKKLITFIILLFTISFASFGSDSIDFSGKDQYNTVQNFEDYRGKVVVLVYWATWCGACQIEIKDIQELYNKFGENKKDVVFIGMNNEKRESVTKFLENKGYTFPTIISNNTMDLFPVTAFPTTVVLNRKGEFETYAVGVLSKEKFTIYLKEL